MYSNRYPNASNLNLNFFSFLGCPLSLSVSVCMYVIMYVCLSLSHLYLLSLSLLSLSPRCSLMTDTFGPFVLLGYLFVRDDHRAKDALMSGLANGNKILLF